MATLKAHRRRTHRRRAPLSASALLPFLLITFGLAWGLLAMVLLIPERLEAWFGPIRASHPLFILAVYAPAIAAIALVAWHAGAAGLGRFLSRLTLWRCSPGWYAFLLVGIPAVFFAGAALAGAPPTSSFDGAGVGALLGALAFMLVLGPVEEVGWRGFALPLLQRHVAPVWAGLLLGLVWGLWHLPAFFVSGLPQSAWGFAPFFLGSVALSVIVTPLFNDARGSILLAALFHFQLNNPLWPDAQPWDSYLFAVVALVVVWVHRERMFSREGAVTEVIPERGERPRRRDE
jgi:membrane protease YdiL (CAAX protease family)